MPWIRIQNALNNHHNSNQYRCDHCKHLRDAKRRFMLGRVPPLLCIQLKRFSFFSTLFVVSVCVPKLRKIEH